ncbi:MAG: glycosyltransferase, partial [Opitutaceae bacterium]|nr:glycosyltransferase [Cytophagales bacterium]
MKEWLYRANEKVVKRLNTSYDESDHDYLIFWISRPSVLLEFLKRFIFLFLKIFIEAKAENFVETEPVDSKIVDSNVNEKPGIYISQGFFNFLLYRKTKLYIEEIPAVYKPLYNVDNFNKADFVFYDHPKPVVSIIIPVYNQLAHTLSCLKTISDNNTVNIEVIVVNDCSTDSTQLILQEISGIKLINNSTNLGFLENCNLAVKESNGEFICFLNNDTQVQIGWLEYLLKVFHDFPDAGGAGSMLIYPDLSLQEAGGLIWKDATGMNVGKFQDVYNPLYRFVRPVDYCSGASLLVRKEDFIKLGLFDPIFKPAYYEDTDLCFSLRSVLNKKIYYHPFSIVIHDEGLSSGTDLNQGVKHNQVLNHTKFKEKWQSVLENHPISEGHDLYKSITRFCGIKTVLVIDSYVPLYDKESGSNRIFCLLKIFKSLNYHVIFLPDDQQKESPYAETLQEMGIDVLYCIDKFQIPVITQLEQRIKDIDVAWICRPELNKKYGTFLKEAGIKTIYDTVDLHFIRLEREEKITGINKKWKKVKETEMLLCKKADKIIAITESDRNTLISNKIEPHKIFTVPNVHIYKNVERTFEERSGLLFIGSYVHTPNEDAVVWLCNEIMPLVWKELPFLKVTLLGSGVTEKVKSLESERVLV